MQLNISHMLSGVKAQICIKIYGDDLDVLRRKAGEMEAAMKNVPGVADRLVEPQVIIPQLRIELDRDKLLLNGLTARDVNEFIETAMNGDPARDDLLVLLTIARLPAKATANAGLPGPPVSARSHPAYRFEWP